MILSKRPWEVWKGIGSTLIFEFGRRLRDKDGSRRGTYTLWIYMADWRIRKAGREIAHSESSDAVIHRAASTLTGKKLEAVFLKTFVTQWKLLHGSTFCFEGGHYLDAWAYEHAREDDDVFFLYSPDACTFYHRDGTMTSGSMDSKRQPRGSAMREPSPTSILRKRAGA